MRPRAPAQNQQTRALISTQKTPHKDNNKDLNNQKQYKTHGRRREQQDNMV